MATYEVSTWAELVARMADTTLETRTIKLTADIDCNDSIPEGVASTVNIVGSNSYPCTIDGSYTEDDVTKHHVIRNLRTNVTSPVSIFRVRAHKIDGSGSADDFRFNVTIQNIDFINVIVDGANMFSCYINTSSLTDCKLKFKNCSFVGRRNRFLVEGKSLASSSNSLTFESCFINIPYKPSGTSNTYVALCGKWEYGGATYAYARYCRIKEYYNGWTIGSYGEYAQCSTYNLGLSGCYIYGNIVGNSTICISYYNSNYGTSYSAPMQNVVDADLRCLGNSGTSVTVYMPKGIYKTAENNNTNVVKKYGDDTVNYTVTNGNSYAIPETPTRMISPADLYADGFDVVVPD